MSEFLKFLHDLLEEAAAPLPGVSHKRMFGCDALFADGTIFGLIWKDGRIGLKVPDAEAYNELMALDGSQPWVAGSKQMGSWVLVPESFHDDRAALAVWTRRAHARALATGPKAPRAKKKAARA